MLSRIAAIFTVLYLSSSICIFASAQRNDKICEHCRKMATTGSSPYEVLWTLRGGIGKQFVSEVLERKMLLRITDIKQAEGIFLEYCRNLCLHTLDGKIWDKTGKSKKDKTLHFQSLQEEEKYTKLGRKELKRLKKKIESASGVKKTTRAKRKPTTVRPNSNNNNYEKIYNDLMPNLNFLSRLSSSRSLQPPPTENLTVDDSITLNDTMELSLRQIPDQTTTMPGSDSNTTDTSEDDNTTETSFDMTGEDTTEESLAPTMPTSSESEESIESDEESYEDDSTEEESEESKESKEVSPKPDKPQEKDDFDTLIKYLIGLTSDPDSDAIFRRVNSLTRTIVNCVIDITMTEVERVLGITPGILVRERCETSHEKTSLESMIVNFLRDILEQSSNLQSVIPVAGVLLPPPITQPQSVFQPELPPNLEFQPNYPDLSPRPQYYNDYDEGIPPNPTSQQEISSFIPSPPIISPPFLTQNNYFEEEPMNYPDYSETEPFIAFPDLTEPPPRPSLPLLGSASAFENFFAWRRAMSDDENNDEEQQPQESPSIPSTDDSVMNDDVPHF